MWKSHIWDNHKNNNDIETFENAIKTRLVGLHVIFIALRVEKETKCCKLPTNLKYIVSTIWIEIDRRIILSGKLVSLKAAQGGLFPYKVGFCEGLDY